MPGAVTRREVGTVRPRDEQQTRKHRPDYLLLILAASLLAIGVVVVYAISPALATGKNVTENYFVTHQLIAVALGIIVFAITSRVPYQYWRHAYVPLLVIAGLATLLALMLPVNAQYPAHRWIRLGGFSFQSVELLKFALIMWMAAFLAKRIQDGSVVDYKKNTEADRHCAWHYRCGRGLYPERPGVGGRNRGHVADDDFFGWHAHQADAHCGRGYHGGGDVSYLDHAVSAGSFTDFHASREQLSDYRLPGL